MDLTKRFKHIWDEMLCHLPFTAGGAAIGIAFMLLFRNMGQETGSVLFQVFHPGHVILSAMVTSSLFLLHTKKKNILVVILVGYFGSVGIATLSDCVIPYFGEEILGASVPSHAALHETDVDAEGHKSDIDENHLHKEIVIESKGEQIEQSQADSDHVHVESCEHENHKHGLHLGFIENWYIVNPAAFLGIFIAWYLPSSRYPHGIHVLISTWASSSHMLMNTSADMTFTLLSGMFVVLLIAVWLPCCVSDILFPLLFVKGDINLSCRCSGSHNHDLDSLNEEKG